MSDPFVSKCGSQEDLLNSQHKELSCFIFVVRKKNTHGMLIKDLEEIKKSLGGDLFPG